VIGIFDYRAKGQLRRLLSSVALLCPEVVLYFTYRHHDMATGISWSSLRQKIIGLFPFAFTYNYRFDVVLLICLFLLLLLAPRWTEGMRVVMPSAMTTGLLLLWCYLMAPYKWLGVHPWIPVL
jgi:hypothetical protein